MGLKQKLVGLVGIVALAGALVFGGLAVADDSGSDPEAEQANVQLGFTQAWPKKIDFWP